MPMLAELVDAVVGGDTHRDAHTLQMLTPTGVALADCVVDNDDAGFARAAVCIAEQAPGPHVVVGLEGTRSYGIGLNRALTAAGLQVVEVDRPKRAERRRGKSDPIDAHLAALATLRMPADRLTRPRADGTREALRILLAARHDMTAGKTRHTNQLRALLLSGDDTDRQLARGRLSEQVLQTIARRRGRTADTIVDAVRRAELRRLALAVAAATTDLAANKTALTALIDTAAPGLLTKPGIGPVSAAQALITWSHHGRCRTDAAFAALAGANPIPASSGRTTRHRLNRGGDRQLNRALHTIAVNRARDDDRTKTYVARRRAEGKTDRDIRRCLKRYIARELFRTLQALPATA